jgi:hypothetical protein
VSLGNIQGLTDSLIMVGEKKRYSSMRVIGIDDNRYKSDYTAMPHKLINNRV